MLPGALVFPEDAPVRHLASPRIPTATVVRADPNVLRTRKAPAPQRVVVRRIYVPAARSVPSASVVRHVPARSTPSKPRRRTSPPSAQRLTPLAATPSQPTRAKKPKKTKKPKKDEQRSSDKKKQDDGEGDDEEEYDDDEGDDRGDGDEDDDDRGDDSIDG